MNARSAANLKANLSLAEALASAANALLAVAQSLGSGVQGQSLVPHFAPANQPADVVALVNEALVSKARGNRRHRYLLQLRSSWKLFADVFGEREPASITGADVEAWVSGLGVGPRTRRGYLIDCRTLFSFALKRSYVPCNPALAVDLPALDDVPPGIHSPDEVRRVLEAARARDVDVMRLLAVQYFAGVRPAEAAALTEAELSPEWLEVKAERSKSRQRRLVSVNATLAAWLAVGGTLPVVNLTKRWRAVRVAAGVPWSHDVTRHSFASYHLASGRSQDKTATEMGHRSSALLFRHYRELVTPTAAAEFWALRPG